MRTLNKRELEILRKKEKRMGKKLDVKHVEYRTAFPRSTVCILDTGKFFDDDETLNNIVVGVTMRGKREPENQLIAESQSFVRALEAI